MDELERWARLQGWFLVLHPIGEERWAQWRRVADPDDARHPTWRSEREARGFMEDARRRGRTWP